MEKRNTFTVFTSAAVSFDTQTTWCRFKFSAYIYIYIYIYTHTHTHIYIHTYTHTYMDVILPEVACDTEVQRKHRNSFNLIAQKPKETLKKCCHSSSVTLWVDGGATAKNKRNLVTRNKLFGARLALPWCQPGPFFFFGIQTGTEPGTAKDRIWVILYDLQTHFKSKVILLVRAHAHANFICPTRKQPSNSTAIHGLPVCHPKRVCAPVLLLFKKFCIIVSLPFLATTFTAFDKLA